MSQEKSRYELQRQLTELVGKKFHYLDEYIYNNKLPHEIDMNRWKDKYIGRKPTHPSMLVINRFRPEVDQFVHLIMGVINEHTRD